MQFIGIKIHIDIFKNIIFSEKKKIVPKNVFIEFWFIN